MERRSNNQPTAEELEADSHVRFKAHLNCYRYRTALKFSKPEWRKALKFAWDELYDMPRTHGSIGVMIIPTCAVALFREKGLKFETQEVARHGEVAKEVMGLRVKAFGWTNNNLNRKGDGHD